MWFQQDDSVEIDEWPGQEYIVEKVLWGGMGVLYKCREKDRPELKIVLKTLRPDLIARPDAKERFRWEAEAWINLGDHPNIVRAHFLARISGEPHLVLEYIEGVIYAMRFSTDHLISKRSLTAVYRLAMG